MNTQIKVIEPTGILDSTQAQEFREEIKESLTGEVKIILIDFTNVSFMDSSGLGALVLALKTVRSFNGKLYLCSVNEQVRMLFELTSMDRVFEMFADRQEFYQKINWE